MPVPNRTAYGTWPEQGDYYSQQKIVPVKHQGYGVLPPGYPQPFPVDVRPKIGPPTSHIPRDIKPGQPREKLPGLGHEMFSDFQPAPGPMPSELNMTTHPPYTVAPPDVLILDAIRMVPKPPFRLQPMDVLLIEAPGAPKEKPIAGQYVVSPDGTINLGFDYSAVLVRGLTLVQAQSAIRAELSKKLAMADVRMAVVQSAAMQQIRGEHLVRPDGTLHLGTYGCVYVAGMTLGQIKTVLEMYLSQYLDNPQVSVDVAIYNSKKYYVIFDGGGFGQQVFELPATGNETVLSAIAKVQGLSPVSSKRRIWVSRPAPCGHGCTQVLPVDWNAITQGASTCTNYQLFPGDRVFVKADALIALDNFLSKMFAPIERVLGITLLGSQTVQSFRGGTTGFIAIP